MVDRYILDNINYLYEEYKKFNKQETRKEKTYREILFKDEIQK